MECSCKSTPQEPGIPVAAGRKEQQQKEQAAARSSLLSEGGRICFEALVELIVLNWSFSNLSSY